MDHHLHEDVGARRLLPVTALIGTALLAAGALALVSQPTSASGASCSRVVVAAGDMTNGAARSETGRVAAAQRPDFVLTLGDEQYPAGALADFRSKYDKTPWGALKPSTKPAPGNHEYMTPGAAGYFSYFSVPAYYAYDLGCGWRGYALNSEVAMSTQASWLRSDLAAHPASKVLAYWHRPRYSSGTHHGSDPAMQPLWDALTGRKALVLNGHEHNYERVRVSGVRQFVVGTGGSAGYGFGPPVTGSEFRLTGVPGVLRLVLGGGYDWRFLDRSGAVRDSGTG